MFKNLDFVDFYVENKHTNKFRSFVAISIAIYALILSVISIKLDSVKDDLHSTGVEIANTWNFYQAKTIRQTFYKLSIDSLEIDSKKDISKESREIIQQKIVSYKDTVERYEIEVNDGKQDLYAKAKSLEASREKIKVDINFFAYAHISQTIAIVMAAICLIKNGYLGYTLYGISTGLTVFSLLLLIILSI